MATGLSIAVLNGGQSNVRVIDSQVHAWDSRVQGTPHDRPAVTGEDTIRVLDAAGVAAAILVSPSSIYGFDSSYALSVAEQYPRRFRVVGPVDLRSPGVNDFVARWATLPVTAGLRLVVRNKEDELLATSPAAHGALNEMVRQQMPLNVWCPNRLRIVSTLASEHPNLQIVVDHLGIPFAPDGRSRQDRLTAEYPALAALANYPNVAVKMSGVPALSDTAFPFVDVWPFVDGVVKRFGARRVLWGSDWTRLSDCCTYAEGLSWVSRSGLFQPADLEWLLWRAARDIYFSPDMP